MSRCASRRATTRDGGLYIRAASTALASLQRRPRSAGHCSRECSRMNAARTSMTVGWSLGESRAYALQRIDAADPHVETCRSRAARSPWL